MGQGDLELLAFIGAFTGIMGSWMSLFIGSLLGSIIGIILVIANKLKVSTKIPFGPFLAFGAIIYVLYQNQILSLIFNI